MFTTSVGRVLSTLFPRNIVIRFVNSSSGGIVIGYRVSFTVQKIVFSTSEEDALAVISSTLNSAISIGSFASYIRETAWVKKCPVPLAFSVINQSAPLVELNITSLISKITHSARPSSQPSRQPSSQPTSSPSCQPSSKPTFTPSRQPTSAPSSQPSMSPSLTIDTKWENSLNRYFRVSPLLNVPVYMRSTYYELTVNYDTHYGSCAAWEAFRNVTLGVDLASKKINNVSYIYKSGEVRSKTTVVSCTDTDVATKIMASLHHAPSVGYGVSYHCDGHTWQIKRCPHVARSIKVNSLSMCVDCNNPCRQYNCTDVPGVLTLAPCDSKVNCPYHMGSYRVISFSLSPLPSQGYIYVLIGYGVAWAVLIVLVILCGRRSQRNKVGVNRIPSISPFNTTNILIATPSASNLEMSASGISSISAPSEIGGMKSQALALIDHWLSRVQITSPDGKQVFILTWASYFSSLSALMRLHHPSALPFMGRTALHRYAYTLHLISKISWILFICAVCLYKQFLPDNYDCYNLQDEAACVERKMPFKSDSYCIWVADYNYGHQERHMSRCIWLRRPMTLRAGFHILSVVFAVLCILKVLLSFFVDYILMAPSLAAGRDPLIVRYLNQHHTKVKVTAQTNRPTASTPLQQSGGQASSRNLPQSVSVSDSAHVASQQSVRTADLVVAPPTVQTMIYQQFSNFQQSFRLYLTSVQSQSVMLQPLGQHFISAWQTANPFLLTYSETISELVDEQRHPWRYFWAAIFAPSPKQRIRAEFTALHREVQQWQAYLNNLPPHDAISAASCVNSKLVSLFLCDLMGRNSIDGRIFRKLLDEGLDPCDHQYRPRHTQPFGLLVKILSALVLFASDIIVIAYALLFMKQEDVERQIEWVILALIVFFIESLFIDAAAVAVWEFFVPAAIRRSLLTLRGLIETIFDAYPSNASRGRFSFPEYAFISTKLAGHFPQCAMSDFISYYRSPWPELAGTLFWPAPRSFYHRLCMAKEAAQSTWGCGWCLLYLQEHSVSAMLWVTARIPSAFLVIVQYGSLAFTLWLLLLYLEYCIREKSGYIPILVLTIVPLLLWLMLLAFRQLQRMARISPTFLSTPSIDAASVSSDPEDESNPGHVDAEHGESSAVTPTNGADIVNYDISSDDEDSANVSSISSDDHSRLDANSIDNVTEYLRSKGADASMDLQSVRTKLSATSTLKYEISSSSDSDLDTYALTLGTSNNRKEKL